MKKLLIVVVLGFFASTTKLRRRMAWNCLRGRSVCYRMDITPKGAFAQTDRAIIAYNVYRGDA